MVAVVAVVAFFLALVEHMSKGDWGVLDVTTLMLIGLLFLAVEMCWTPVYRRYNNRT
jgi:hypothetical protein